MTTGRINQVSTFTAHDQLADTVVVSVRITDHAQADQ